MDTLKDFKIDVVLDNLKKRRKIFHCESDFKFELAQEIKEMGVDVRLEYFCGEENNKRKYLDILVINKSKTECIPIELKYKTNESEFEENSEEYHLKEQGAKNNACYYIYKDIERIENIVQGGKKCNNKNFNLKKYKIIKGFVIFLTTCSGYKNSQIVGKASKFNLAITEKEKELKVTKGIKQYDSEHESVNIIKEEHGVWSTYSSGVIDKKGKMVEVEQLIFEICKEGE